MKEIVFLNVADYLIIGVVAISVVISILRGFIKELLSLIIWFLGFWIALKFYHLFAAVLAPYIQHVAVRQITSFAVIFLLVVILGAFFNSFLGFLVVKTGLSGTDRMLGVLFGLARGGLLVAVVLLFISSTSFVQDSWWQKSVLIPYFNPVLDWLKHFIPDSMG